MSTAIATSVSVQAAETLYDFSLSAGPLTDTLIQIGQQSSRQILFIPTDVAQRVSAPVNGRMSAASAVERALQGSGLRLQVTASGALSVQPVPSQGMTLEATSINAAIAGDGSNGEPAGYVAQRSSVGTKTDASLLETPQSVSVVTRAEMDQRKSDNLSDALKYTPVLPVSRAASAALPMITAARLQRWRGYRRHSS